MNGKDSNGINYSKEQKVTEELFKFCEELLALKTLDRAGWVRCGIERPESVADHSFSVSVLAMILSDRLHLDTEKVLRMALIHDLAEIYIGDITPYDKESTMEKARLENRAMLKLLQDLPGGQFYINYWQEYIEQQTLEAQLVRNVDKLEMVVQALAYQKQYSELNLSEFFIDAEQFIEIPEILDLFKLLATQLDNPTHQVQK